LAPRLSYRRLIAPIKPTPIATATAPYTATAIASRVKRVAVPGPAPGPWEANATPADDSSTHNAAMLLYSVLQCALLNDGMTASCSWRGRRTLIRRYGTIQRRF
jgi:hypothetical protein